MTLTSHDEHFHQDEKGIWHRCYHTCKHWLSPGFLAGWIIASTITFPAEHIQWDHIWPFYYVGDWLNRMGHLSVYVSLAWLLVWGVFLVIAFRQAIRGNRD